MLGIDTDTLLAAGLVLLILGPIIVDNCRHGRFPCIWKRRRNGGK